MQDKAMLFCDITRTIAEAMHRQRWTRRNRTVKSQCNKRGTSVSTKPVRRHEGSAFLQDPISPHSCRGTSERVFTLLKGIPVTGRSTRSYIKKKIKKKHSLTRFYNLTGTSVIRLSLL